MAKAGNPPSTIVWIWLHEARAFADAALESKALAEKQLTEWLAAGKVPWTCVKWEGLDAKGLAKLKRKHQERYPLGLLPDPLRLFYPKAAYRPGDPKFWGADFLKIDWEGDAACQWLVHDGAEALGIKVSRMHLLALLPSGELREHKEVRGAAVWIAAEARRMKKADEIPDGITITDFAKILARRMDKAARTDHALRAVGWPHIKNKLREWDCWPVSSTK